MSNSAKLWCDPFCLHRTKSNGWVVFFCLFACKKHRSIEPVSHPPSLSEAESGLKHIMILNGIQQYDSQFHSVVTMCINIFKQVQSSGIAETH